MSADGARPVISDLTLVIPTVGRASLEGCLAAIGDGDAWPSRLLVVDQGRSGAAEGWIAQLRGRGLNAAHIPSVDTGVAAGLNAGIRRVRTRWFAVTHDDCIVSSSWIADVGTILERVGDGTVITGCVEPLGEGPVPSVMTAREPAVHTRPGWRDVLYPANMAMATEVAYQVGPFDEHPLLRWAAEDNDWAYRALRSGVEIRYEPSIVVGHLDWRGDGELEETQRRYVRSQGAFYGKWIRRGHPFVLARALRGLVDGPLVVLRGALTGRRDLVRRGWLSVRNLGPGILAGLREIPADRGPGRSLDDA